jgi:hypothetical protein
MLILPPATDDTVSVPRATSVLAFVECAILESARQELSDELGHQVAPPEAAELETVRPGRAA